MLNRFVLALLVSLINFAAYSAEYDIINNEFGNRVNFNDYYTHMDKSRAGLEVYKGKMISVHRKVEKTPLKRILSTITFSNPMSIDNTSNIINAYGIAPKILYIFGKESGTDSLVTLGVHLSAENFNQDMESAIKILTEANEGSVIGVVSVIGYVETDKLRELQADRNVFLVDVSADKNLTENANNRSYMHHFGWDLYHQN